MTGHRTRWAGRQPPAETLSSAPVERPASGAGSPDHHQLAALQRQAGNAAVVSMVGRAGPGSERPPAFPLFIQRAPGAGGPPPLPGKPLFTEPQYATWRRQHRRHEPRVGGTWEPDFLYKRYTPAWFTAQGYEFGLRLGPFGNVDIDVWIDNRGDGREYRVIRWTDTAGDGSPATGPGAPPTTDQSRSGPVLDSREKGLDLPVSIDPNADYDRLFGPPIARKEGIDAAFGQGNMVLHEDGSLVLYLDDGGQYVFRPVPGGRYVVYDPKGRRLSRVWDLPAAEIPDVDDDADQ